MWKDHGLLSVLIDVVYMMSTKEIGSHVYIFETNTVVITNESFSDVFVSFLEYHIMQLDEILH